jgi:hypothetical protein
MTTQLPFFRFLPNATRIGIVPPATSTIWPARFLGCVSRLALVSASNRRAAARITSKTPWNGSGQLGRTKSPETAVAQSAVRFIASIFGWCTLQSPLIVDIDRPVF